VTLEELARRAQAAQAAVDAAAMNRRSIGEALDATILRRMLVVICWWLDDVTSVPVRAKLQELRAVVEGELYDGRR
jgi:hypothetical protein